MPIAIAGAANLPPYSPVITSPVSGSYVDVASGLLVDWTYTAATQGGIQSAWALRRKLQSATSYQWWSTASNSWQSSQVFNSGSIDTYTFPAGSWSDGNTYQFSMAVQDQFGTSAYSADLTIICQAAPAVTVTAPSGLIPTAQPLIQWSTTLPAGVSQVAYRVVIYNQNQFLGSGFAPGTTVGVYDTGVVQGQFISQIRIPSSVYLPDNTSFRAYVQVTETGAQTSTWAYTAFSTSYAAPAAPTLTATATVDPVTGAPMVSLVAEGTDNLLSAADSSFETGLGNWVNGYNAILVQSTQKALDGSHSLQVVSTNSNQGGIQFGTAGGSFNQTGPGPYSVIAGATYTAIASWIAGYAPRGVQLRITWFDSTGKVISPQVVGTAVNDSSGSWTQTTVTGVAPASAVTAALQGLIDNFTGLGEPVSALPAPPAPTVTVEGTAGTTTYNYQLTTSNQYGETVASAATSVTTGNATLNSTNYQLISWPATPLPAGSSGNLVYDSNLQEAIAAVGPTWSFYSTPTIGTANGDYNVLNPGTNSAEWVYYGTGSAAVDDIPTSQIFEVVAGATYTFSIAINASNVISGTPAAWVQAPGYGNPALELDQSAGGNTILSGTFTASGTQLIVTLRTFGCTVTAGAQLTWSQIQLTQTSTVQPYEPGPLFTTNVYGRTTYDLIASTQALAYEDIGAAPGTATPPTTNTTGETHYIDEVGLFQGTKTQWSPGGFVGQTVVQVMASDDGGVTWASIRDTVTPVAIPTSNQTVDLVDYEATPGKVRQYQAFTQDPGLGVESNPSATASATTSTTSWWMIDPLNPGNALSLFVNGHSSSQTEQSTAHYTVGNPFPTITASTVGGSDGTLAVQTVTQAEYNALRTLMGSQAIQWLISPLGDGLYVRVGPQPGGMSSGYGNATRQSQLSPSSAANPVVVTNVTYVEVAKP